MPFGLGKKGRSPYKDLERAPLSARDQDDDDDDDDMPLPPYSDTPDVTTPTNGSKSRRGARRKKNGRSSRKLSDREDDDEDDDEDNDRDYDDYDDDDGFGERDHRRAADRTDGRPPKYRAGLVFAYLRHWMTCGCLGRCVWCLAEDTSSRRGNIAGSRYCGPEAKGRLRKCGRFLAGLSYLALLGLMMACAMGVGYILARDGHNPSAAELLQSPPDDLHDACSDWITAAGRERCETECAAGSCCYDDGGGESCWTERAEECAAYRSACMVLELHPSDGGGGDDDANGPGGDDVVADDVVGDGDSDSGALLPSLVNLDAPMPSYLDQACSPALLRTPGGFDACSDACRPSRCCHPETYGCDVVPEDRKWCAAYEGPCANVAETWRGSGHVAAGGTDGDDGNNEATTPSQSAAGPVSASGSSLPEQSALNQQVMQACNSAALNPPDACIEVCYAGACCFGSSSSARDTPIEEVFAVRYGAFASPFATVESCRDHAGFCQQFGACEHLNHLVESPSGSNNEDDDDDPKLEVDVSEVCTTEYVAQYGALECSNVCQPAHCCFSEEYSCSDVQLAHLDCTDYGDCGVLYPASRAKTDMVELFKLAKLIDEQCAEELVDSLQGRRKCQDVCKDRLCCFAEGKYGCADDPSQNCLAYAGCVTLVETPASPAGAVKSNANNVESHLASDAGGSLDFVASLEEACSESNFETRSGIQQCHDKCQTHLCCFDDGNACENAHVDACEAYKPCERLVTHSENPAFVPSSPGANEKAPLDLDAIKREVELACGEGARPSFDDESWVRGCHDVCAPRICCFLDPAIGSNCRDTARRGECGAYGTCEVLLDYEDEGGDSEDFADLDDWERTNDDNDIGSLCSDLAKQDHLLYDRCTDKCDERSCCFEEEPAYSCYSMEKDWCNEYILCENVGYAFLTDSTPPVTAPARNPVPNANADFAHELSVEASLESVCHVDALNTAGGIENCFHRCQAHMCCFPGDAAEQKFDCSDTYPDQCSEYGVCENLVSLYKQWQPPLTSYDPHAIKNAVNDVCLPHQGNPVPFSEEWVHNCHSVCEARLCCFSNPYPLGSNCMDILGEKECNDYSSCTILIGEEDSDSINLHDICNEASANGESLHSCEDECNKRSCCFEEIKELSCYDMAEDWCHEYEACHLVGLTFIDHATTSSEVTTVGNKPTTTTTEPNMESDIDFKGIDTKCSIEYISNFGIDECETLCEPVQCCFSFSKCASLTPSDCPKVRSCDNFYNPKSTDLVREKDSPSLTLGPSVDRDEFLDLCSPEKIKQNRNSCESLCSPFACCFTLDDSCYRDNHQACEEFYICEEFSDEKEEDWDDASPTNSPRSSSNGVGSDVAIDALCTDEAFFDPDLFSRCSDKCDDRSCCFEDESEYSCFEEDKKWCQEYARCEVVGKYFYSTATTTTNNVGLNVGSDVAIDALCTDEALLDPDLFSRCSDKCDDRSCCFEDESEYSCFEEDNKWCEEYARCKIVGKYFYSTATTTTTTTTKPTTTTTEPNNVGFKFKTLCTKWNMANNWETCKHHCAQFECCFTKEESCYQENKLQCDEYFICEDFYEEGQPGTGTNLTPNNAPTINNAPTPASTGTSGSSSLIDLDLQQSFETLCSSSSVQQNWETCGNICSKFECCFTRGDSCYQANKRECDEHYICEDYFYVDERDIITAPPMSMPTTSGLSSKTGSDSISTSESFKALCSESNLRLNWDTCENHCADFECCFLKENSCYMENKLECDEYFICEEFFMDDAGADAKTEDALSTGSLEVTESLEAMQYRCSASHIMSHLDDCAKWCAPHDCCFNSSNPCYLANKQECDDHDVCKSVRYGATGNTDVNSNGSSTSTLNLKAVGQGLNAAESNALETACAIKQLRLNDNQCKDLCGGSACCFSEYSHCRGMEQFCNDHAICSRMFD